VCTFSQSNSVYVTALTSLEQCIEVNMNKVVIKILQGSVVTQTLLGGLTMYSAVG